MGVTAMIPNMTFQQLKDEANSRWGEIWDSNSSRLEIMLLCPRKERKLLELHGDMIDHGQPVMGIFHRPRGMARSNLLKEEDLDDGNIVLFSFRTASDWGCLKRMVLVPTQQYFLAILLG